MKNLFKTPHIKFLFCYGVLTGFSIIQIPVVAYLYEQPEVKFYIDFTLFSSLIFTFTSFNLPQYINTRFNLQEPRKIYDAINALICIIFLQGALVVLGYQFTDKIYLLSILYSVIRLLRVSILYTHINKVNVFIDSILIFGPMLLTTLYIPYEVYNLNIEFRIFVVIISEFLIVGIFIPSIYKRVKFALLRFNLTKDVIIFSRNSLFLAVIGLLVHLVPRLLISSNESDSFSTQFLLAYSIAFYILSLSEPFTNIAIHSLALPVHNSKSDRKVNVLRLIMLLLSLVYVLVCLMLFLTIFSEKYPSAAVYFCWISVGMIAQGLIFVENIIINQKNAFKAKYFGLSVFILVLYPSFIIVSDDLIAIIYGVSLTLYSIIVFVFSPKRSN